MKTASAYSGLRSAPLQAEINPHQPSSKGTRVRDRAGPDSARYCLPFPTHFSTFLVLDSAPNGVLI